MKLFVNDIQMHYEKTGSGTPLILLHGNGEDHHIFDEVKAHLQKSFTVYAIDSRNHGDSAKTDNYSYETMCEDIHSFIEALHLHNVNIIGFSDGAIVSLLLAIKHSQVLNKMALLGVNLQPTDFTKENYQFIKETYEKTHDPLYKLMLEQPNIDIAELAHIHIPTLLIAAENDLYHPDLFKNIQATLPNATLKIMEGHDHASYIIHQDLLSTDFLNFFTS